MFGISLRCIFKNFRALFSSSHTICHHRVYAYSSLLLLSMHRNRENELVEAPKFSSRARDFADELTSQKIYKFKHSREPGARMPRVVIKHGISFGSPEVCVGVLWGPQGDSRGFRWWNPPKSSPGSPWERDFVTRLFAS